jgi:hypothetical protein
MIKKLERIIRNFFDIGDYKISIIEDSISPSHVRLTTYLIEGELTTMDRISLTSADYNVYTLNNKNLVTGTSRMRIDGKLESLFQNLRRAIKPDYLKEAKWHIPFKNNIDYTKLYFFVKEREKDFGKCSWCEDVIIDRYILRIAAARCAEINTSNSSDFQHDLDVYSKLNTNALRHIAQAQNDLIYHEDYCGWKPANLFLG